MDVTLALFAYNQERFIEAALRSALGQTCDPIQIIASDDCSSDNTFGLMQAVADGYSGPHRLLVRRNEKNLGIGAHVNELMRLAEGRLVVLMAGDDISLPQRVERTVRAWKASGERLDLLAAHVFDMSPDGQDLGIKRVDTLQQWRSIDDWLRRRPYVIGAAHAVTRRLFARFGPLADDAFHEDEINAFRAICSGGGQTIDEPLVRYRRGGLSRTPPWAKTFVTAETRRNAMYLAMFDQWIRDAAIAGCKTLVESSLEWEVQRELFIRRLQQTATLRDQLKVVAASSDLPRGWRLKRLVQRHMPRTAKVIKHVKSSWRRDSL